MLQDDDFELLEILTSRVRVLSFPQWSATSKRKNPKAQLSRLVANKYLTTYLAGAQSLPVPEFPLVRWKAKDEPPNFTQLATLLRKRWALHSFPTAVYLATRLASNRVGGYPGRRPRPSELSHDLALTGVYLRHYHGDSSMRANWMSEVALYHAGYGIASRLPDAMMNRKEGQYAVELAGVYTAKKIQAFHAFCQEAGIGYELW